ncbi:hypothetical protein ACFL08_00580 [Patescibacteria group bacterium]
MAKMIKHELECGVNIWYGTKINCANMYDIHVDGEVGFAMDIGITEDQPIVFGANGLLVIEVNGVTWVFFGEPNKDPEYIIKVEGDTVNYCGSKKIYFERSSSEIVFMKTKRVSVEEGVIITVIKQPLDASWSVGYDGGIFNNPFEKYYRQDEKVSFMITRDGGTTLIKNSVVGVVGNNLTFEKGFKV